MADERPGFNRKNTLSNISFPEESGLQKLPPGKVRERFLTRSGRLILIATDRVSAFDKVFGLVENKGQILTGVSQLMFELTKDIIPNHLLAIPDPNVMVVQPTRPLPIEFVVRGYMKMGKSSTSLGGMYAAGQRKMYGLTFRDGYKHGDKLDQPVLTPTTKAQVGHDRPVSETEILNSGVIAPDTWHKAKNASFTLFSRATKYAEMAGLLLVDTKLEFGLREDGTLLLIDELFTPDSAGFWKADTYQERLNNGRDPEIMDKEIFRRALVELGYSEEAMNVKIPKSVFEMVSTTYAQVYKALTFKTPVESDNIAARIGTNLQRYLSIE